MTFRKWLQIQIQRKNQAGDVREELALLSALEEFDRRFKVATLEELATSTGTVWIEKERGDE